MNKKKIIILIVLLGIILIYWLNKKEENEINQANSGFIQCLSEKGIIIYGTRTCPACSYLEESLGGYELIDKIFVDCAEDNGRCSEEMKTKFVPEVQINGILYEDIITPEILAEETGCKL